MKSIVSVLIFCFVQGLVSFSNSVYAQKPCFDDCWSRINKSSSPFAPLDMLKELVGCQAPDFSVETIDGETISLSELTGSVIVMNFWFMGCKPCIEEMPLLNDLVEKYQNDKKIIFLSFARDSKEDIVAKFLPKYDFKYEIVSGKYDITRKYCVQPNPVHFVIDRSGKVVLTSFDSVAKDDNFQKLTDAIEGALTDK